MPRSFTLAASVALLGITSTLPAAEIQGEYLEARSCSVYTGPCFANAEMGQAGKEAVMAWKVEKGGWDGVSLDGLSVALVVSAENTLGDDGVFAMRPGKTQAVVLVDEQASEAQQKALVAFVAESAPALSRDIVKIEAAPIELSNDHILGRGLFTAGDVARIETRKLAKGDCVCSNEVTYYLPLTEIENASPAFSKVTSFTGEGLGKRWTTRGERSAFLGTFRR